MKPATLFLFLALLFFPPATAWGANEECPLGGDEAVDWGPIGTIDVNGGNCEGGANPPDGDDIILFPTGSDVTVIDDITFTADGSGIVCQDGASFTASAVDQDDELIFTFFDGQDTYPGGDSNVALLLEAGCEVVLEGGFAQRSNSGSFALQDSVSEADATIWTLDQWSVCGDGSGDTPDSIGGAQDCATGDEEYLWCPHFSVARNNPDAGGDGDNYLHGAIQDLQDDWMLVWLSPGMDYPHAYPITVSDKVLPAYEFCLDLRQQFTAYGQANADMPLTSRISIVNEIDNTATVIPQKGDTHIVSNTSIIANDGELAGQCVRMCDASGANCDPYVYRIARTEDGVANDILYFSDLTPLRKDYATDAMFTISPICAQAGDNFAILAPIVFLNGDTSYADDESKVLIQSTNVTMNGVVFNGSGLIHFDQAVLNPSSDMIHAIDTGPVKFEAMPRVDMSCWTSVGGDVAGGNVSFEFADTSGMTHVQDSAVRYAGDWAFTTSGSAMGPAEFERIKCEWGADATMTSEGCIKNATDWSSVRVKDMACIDCTKGSAGASSDAVAASTNPMLIDGFLAYGMTEGGAFRHGTGTGVSMWNLLGRGVLTNRINTPWAGLSLNHFDVRDFVTSTMTVPIDPFVGALTTNWQNGILADIITSNDEILGIAEGGSGGDTLSNIIIWDGLTTNTTGTSDLINITHDSTAATTSTVEYITVGWNRGTTSDWDTVIASTNDNGTETGFNFGHICITEHQGSDADTDYVTIALDDDIVDEIVNRTGGNVCIDSGSVATGGAGSYEPVTDSSLFATAPLLGFVPAFEDAGNGYYVLRNDTRVADLECGAKTRSGRPGVNPNGHCWLYEQVGAPCPKRPYIVEEGGAF